VLVKAAEPKHVVSGVAATNEHVAGPTSGDQLALVRERARSARPHRTVQPALSLPVARVAVDVALAHVDRPFEYLVPEPLSMLAQPGVRVRVRFAGRDRDGFVLDRLAEPGFGGALEHIRRVISPERVLTPEIARLARLVADRYAGTMADVLRLAVPARHARVEKEARPAQPDLHPLPEPLDPGPWSAYPAGAAFLAALAAGDQRRAVVAALPGPTWPQLVAVAAAAALAAARGTVVVVPDSRDLAAVDRELQASLGDGRHVTLTADLGPAERYRRWLAVLRGEVQVVAGTRAAMFAPVRDLGLVAIWDDGDDLHAELRAPYPHAREVLCLRAHETGAAALIAGYAVTAEAAHLVRTGWARYVPPLRALVRSAAPRVRSVGEDVAQARDPAAATARLPTLAWETARASLSRPAPVLVLVPRRGYVPGLACRDCRAPARCAHCTGPLALSSGHAIAACGWCGRPSGGWRCPHCEGREFRAQVVGAGRTAEELGRAFPSVPVRTSGGGHVLAAVGPEAALVIATPGAEPTVAGGYGAALLLDGWALLSRPDLRAGEETLRRWLNAAALVRPGREGGTVVVMSEGDSPVVQALIRWDPGGFAERELADRATSGFPPAVRLGVLTGTAAAVGDFLRGAEFPPSAEVLGPVPFGRDGKARAIVRVPKASGTALAAALRAARGTRAARKDQDVVRVQIDPVDIG
jgi:primosomal protein N' (replication factor Y)